MTRSGTQVSRSIVQRAEALLRSLIGVTQAEVHVRPTGGVERVRLVADGGLSNGQIVQNVRSALLAALGVVLQPGQIEFVDASEFPALVTDQGEVPADGMLNAPVLPETAVTPADGPGSPAVGVASSGSGGDRHPAKADCDVGERVTNGSANGSGKRNGGGSASKQSNGGGQGAYTPVVRVPAPRLSRRGRSASAAVTGSPFARPAAAPGGGNIPGDPVAEGSGEGVETIAAREVRLLKVETLRQAGRLRCRVVLVAGEDYYSAVADCSDRPLAELHLAGRVTCDALRAGDLTQFHFEGATVANLAGGMHVLVALSGWNHGEPVRRSGSAVIGKSAEQAAAHAVLHALANT